MFRLKGLAHAVLGFALILGAGQSMAAAAFADTVPWELFGSREIGSTNMTAFSKWTDMWRKYNSSRAAAPVAQDGGRRCVGADRIECSREAWDAFIEENRGKPARDLLGLVNSYMNRAPYIVDPVNWGVPDYWASPDEFFFKDGDCEDYAISKYVTLMRMGYDTTAMRLVILQDENLRAAHAVLAVELDGDIFVLDNQVDAVLSHTQILHYRPVYSINESGWWLHQVRRFSQ